MKTATRKRAEVILETLHDRREMLATNVAFDQQLVDEFVVVRGHGYRDIVEAATRDRPDGVLVGTTVGCPEPHGAVDGVVPDWPFVGTPTPRQRQLREPLVRSRSAFGSRIAALSIESACRRNRAARRAHPPSDYHDQNTRDRARPR